MKDSIFRAFVKLITLGYERLFHEKMSDEVKKFFKDLSYVGLGSIIAIIFSFPFNIFAGRILGPSGYGEFALVQSIAMFLYIPMILGVGTAMVKYNAEKEVLDSQQMIISTTYILVLVFTIVSIFLYYLLSSQISNIFSISEETFYLSVVFAVLFVFYTLTTNTLRGLHEMRKYAMFQPVYSIIMLSVFLVFILINFISFKSMLLSMYLAYVVTGGLILVFVRKYIRFEFDAQYAKKLVMYGAYAIIGGISFTFYTNIDKILINMYMTIEDVGLYRAYYFASINMAGLFFGIFITAFFPFASKCNDKAAIFKKISEVTPYLFGFGFPLIVLSEFVILRLYGGEYPINFSLMLLFAIVSILVVYYGIYDWTFCSEGATGVKLVGVSTLIIAIINIILNIYLIPRFALFGAIGSTAIAFFIGICFLISFKGRIS